MPGDQEGLEEQEESAALTTSLVYTSINDDAAELSEDDCDDVDNDHGTGKEGSLATANYHHINLPGVPPATNLQNASNSADNDNHQRAQKDPKLTEVDKNQQEGNIFQAKLAMSVAKVIGTTPVVRTLDKQEKPSMKNKTETTSIAMTSRKILWHVFRHKCLLLTSVYHWKLSNGKRNFS